MHVSITSALQPRASTKAAAATARAVERNGIEAVGVGLRKSRRAGFDGVAQWVSRAAMEIRGRRGRGLEGGEGVSATRGMVFGQYGAPWVSDGLSKKVAAGSLPVRKGPEIA